MKDPILEHIENKRAQLDQAEPSDLLWQRIESDLHPKEQNRTLIWWTTAAAGILILLLFNVGNFEAEDHHEQLSQNQQIDHPNREPNFDHYSDPRAARKKYLRDQMIRNVLGDDYEFSHDLSAGYVYDANFVRGRANLEFWGLDLQGGKSVDIAIPEQNLNGVYTVELNAINASVPFMNIKPNQGVNRTYNIQVDGGEFTLDRISNEPFDVNRPFRGNNFKTLILRDGGTFTMGRVEQDVSYDSYSWNFGDADNEPHPFNSANGRDLDLGQINKKGRGRAIRMHHYPKIDPFKNVGQHYNNESYNPIVENKFKKTLDEHLSTFSIDVDGAAYSNVRRYINDNMLPPKDAVRVEEFINYFNYELEAPSAKDEHPFNFSHEIHECPWNAKNQLLQITMKGQEILNDDLPASNLVFLLDVSGSMSDHNKLPLLKKGMKMLSEQLRAKDKVSIVVYAGAAGVVLEPTAGDRTNDILEALNNLEAGGSTAGGEGIELAYRLAEKHFVKGGNNRIVLATDGDFNVGISDQDELIKLIEKKRKTGVFLSVMGYGMGNLQDGTIEQIANKGNGNYSYIDNVMEAKKVMVTEFGGTMFTIAKDVKLQLEFNPAKVESYRLIGYENRVLNNEDFANDTVDAGELGAGHSIVALYELVPAKETANKINTSKYQKVELTDSEEWMTIKFRYKEPDGTKSKLIEYPVTYEKRDYSRNFLLSSSLAEYGLLLRDSEHKGTANFENAINRATRAKGRDPKGYRAEFIRLLEMSEILMEEYLKRVDK